MPTFTQARGMVLTVHVQAAFEEFEWNIPVAGHAALDSYNSPRELATRWESSWRSAYLNCMAADVWLRGISVRGMIKGHIIPVRYAYEAGSTPGTIPGESVSTNCSVLLARYSGEQVSTLSRTQCGKSYIGPPPESKSVGPILFVPYVTGVVTTLATLLKADFVGGTTAITYSPVVSAKIDGAEPLYPVDVYAIRSIVATQRPRLRPHA